MFISGIADEAHPELTRQLEAHRQLGWQHIEIRMIEGTNLTDVSDAQFDEICEALSDAGMTVSCFAAQLCNWARPISTDFDVDRSELERAIPRMQKLGTPFIRCMSYPNSDPALPEPEWRKQVVDRMKTLARMAEDGGVTLVHENCDGWGGISPQHTLDLLADVGSDHLKLVFDTGNPIPHKQDAWDYYSKTREHVVYVHIKDYTESDDGKEGAVYAGDGNGYVREIIKDLLERGYDGGFSIEPQHLQRDPPWPRGGRPGSGVQHLRRIRTTLHGLNGRADRVEWASAKQKVVRKRYSFTKEEERLASQRRVLLVPQPRRRGHGVTGEPFPLKEQLDSRAVKELADREHVAESCGLC